MESDLVISDRNIIKKKEETLDMKLPMNNWNMIECLVYEAKDCLLDKERKR